MNKALCKATKGLTTVLALQHTMASQTGCRKEVALAIPEPGSRIRKTTETEILPPSSAGGAHPSEFYNRDFWELIWSFSSDEWREHVVRVYRRAEHGEDDSGLAGNKFGAAFDEDMVRERWGGGDYWLWLYGPPNGTKLVRKFHLVLEGTPKPSSTPAAGAAAAASGEGGALDMMLRELLAELRQSRGGDLAQGAMKNALEIQFQAQKQAIEIMGSAYRPAAAGPSPFDEMFKTLLTALVPAVIAKFTNPANPIEEFKTMAGAVREALTMMGANKAEKTNTLDTLISHMPSVIEKAVGGIHEYRLATESQERSLRLQAGTRTIDMPSSSPGPASPSPTSAEDGAPFNAGAGAPGEPSSAVPPGPVAVPNTKPEVHQVNGPTKEWVLLTIVDKIEKDPSCTGEDLFDWLRNIAPPLMEQLSSMTRDQVIQIFGMEPILAKVQNHPRLPQMIDEFLLAAKEFNS